MRFFRSNKNNNHENDIVWQRRHILSNKTNFFIREAYKSLRTNIVFAAPNEGCRKIAFTSSVAGEGKSISVLNTAISFAEAGQRVLLMDADLRKPKLAKLVQRKATPGLTNILVNMSSIEQSVHKEVFPNVDILFSGDIPPNPSELLGHEKMEQLLQTLSANYDYIFIDTPPVGVLTDACVLSRLLDGVVFVVRQGRTDSDAVTSAVNQLLFAEAKVLGFILNGTEAGGSSKYGYGKYNKYGYSYEYRAHSAEQTSGDLQ
jgi:capsular exopolysaccharide synthesis family protein